MKPEALVADARVWVADGQLIDAELPQFKLFKVAAWPLEPEDPTDVADFVAAFDVRFKVADHRRQLLVGLLDQLRPVQGKHSIKTAGSRDASHRGEVIDRLSDREVRRRGSYLISTSGALESPILGRRPTGPIPYLGADPVQLRTRLTWYWVRWV